jgi:hypothetical protein
MTENHDMAKRPSGTAALAKARETLGGENAAQAGERVGEAAAAEGAKPDEAASLAKVVEEEVGKATGEVEAGPVADGATTPDAAPSDASATSIPPAPGDDSESVFERRLGRLTTIVEEAEFESGTALGDIVELILDLFKHRPKLWSTMSNDEQKTVVRTIETTAKDVLKKVVLVIAQEDSITLQGTFLGQFNVKGETIEAKVKIEGVDDEVLSHAFRLAGHKVVLVSADDKRFSSKRREPETIPDQVAMRFADDVKADRPKEVEAPPKDDSDLADGADDDNGGQDDDGDGEPGADDDPASFAVHDADGEVWLVADHHRSGEDAWTDNPAHAKRFSRSAAEAEVADYGEGVAIVDHPAPAEG